jgi:protein tyrosine phosphatase (PTP) superfamily phosphohydrolase (DUF442 family)
MVIPEEVYRSAQLSPRALEHRIRKFGLRSVINLRTKEKKTSWLKDEQKVTEVHGVDFHLIRLSAHMPPRETLLKLVRLLDTAKRPMLLHCQMGVGRSGIASAMAVLLAGGTISEARKQFGLTYGFVPLIYRTDLPKVLDNYEQWLGEQGGSHTPKKFRQWVENNYVPYYFRARLEPMDVPTSIDRGSRQTLYFLATNISPQPWRLSSDRHRGVHLGAKVRSSEANPEKEISLHGGLRDLTVSPGESVVLELEIPLSLESGDYHFFVDLVDERGRYFSYMGSEPITFKLSVEKPDPLR